MIYVLSVRLFNSRLLVWLECRGSQRGTATRKTERTPELNRSSRAFRFFSSSSSTGAAAAAVLDGADTPNRACLSFNLASSCRLGKSTNVRYQTASAAHHDHWVLLDRRRGGFDECRLLDLGAPFCSPSFSPFHFFFNGQGLDVCFECLRGHGVLFGRGSGVCGRGCTTASCLRYTRRWLCLCRCRRGSGGSIVCLRTVADILERVEERSGGGTSILGAADC